VPLDVIVLLVKDMDFIKDALPFWTELDAKQKTFMEEKLVERCYREGQLIHDGEDCTGLLLVKNGQLRIFVLSESGKEITLFRLFEHDVCILSSSCIMRNITFDIQVEAEKNSEILIMPAAVFKHLCDANPAVKAFEAEIVSARLSDVMWVVEQVVFMSMDKRLANFLLEQSAIEESDELFITHDTIARDLGTAREVISRMLKYFENEGLVVLSRGKVTLLDRKKLMECAN
jgi:CRP/FNR family transcriptional regulator